MEEVPSIRLDELTLQAKAFSVKYLPEYKNGWIVPLTIDVDSAEDSKILVELDRVVKKSRPRF